MNISKREVVLLLGAVLIGLLVRVPGVSWGANFPFGWFGHHPDEYTHSLHTQLKINYRQPKYDPVDNVGLLNPWMAGYSVTPYPVAMAMHVALPHIASRVLSGTVLDPPPPPSKIIPTGRSIVVAYGVATIVVLFFLAKCLFSNPAVPIIAAWMMALGGLHVTQSHFFLSGVPALFWLLLGLIFLWRDQANENSSNSSDLAIAALCLGVAFGFKLFFPAVPSLALVALLHKDKIWRLVLVTVFFLFGMFAINAGMYTPVDFYSTIFRGISDPFEFSILSSFILYIIELPSILSFPVFILSLIGVPLLLVKLFKLENFSLKRRIVLVILLPMIMHLLTVLFVLDHFPRHLLPFIPAFILVSAWVAVKLAERVKVAPRIIAIPIIIYLAVFIYDAEKGFIDDPRNKAADWLIQNVEKGRSVTWYYHSPQGYKNVADPTGRPDVILEEMHHANHYLSGLGLRDSMPRDYRKIFDSHSQEYIDAYQALFTGDSEYKEVARFGENYFMPEYILTDRLIGNRSRNYLAEIIVFKRKE